MSSLSKRINDCLRTFKRKLEPLAKYIILRVEKNPKKISDLFILFLAVAFISGFYYVIFLVTWDIFERNVGRFDLIQIFGWAYILFMVLLFSFNYIIVVICRLLNKRPPYWILITVFVMILFFFVGVAAIDNEIGYKDLEHLKLRDKDSGLEVVGGIVCKGSNKVIFVGEKVSCNMTPLLDDTSASLYFTLQNGTIIEEKIDDLSFKAIPYVEYISFDIKGMDENNLERSLSIGYPYHFLTQEEYRNHRKDFITYTLALVGIILFSVPSMFVNFRILYRKSDK